MVVRILISQHLGDLSLMRSADTTPGQVLCIRYAT